MAIGADDSEVRLGVKDYLAWSASELSQWSQVMRLDVPVSVRAIALGEVEAADSAGGAVVALSVPSESRIAFGAAMPAVPLSFFTGFQSFREFLAGRLVDGFASLDEDPVQVQEPVQVAK